jgi:hypothetical protein
MDNYTSIVNDLNAKNNSLKKDTPNTENIFQHKVDRSYPLHSMKVHTVPESSHVVSGTSMNDLVLRYKLPRVGLVSYMLLVLKLDSTAHFAATFDVYNIIREVRVVADNAGIVYSERPSNICKTISDMGFEFAVNCRALSLDTPNNTLNIPLIFKNFNDKIENSINTLGITGHLTIEVEFKNSYHANILAPLPGAVTKKYIKSHLLVDFCSPIDLSQNLRSPQTRHLLMHYNEEQKIVNKTTGAGNVISSSQVLKNRGICKEILIHFYKNTGSQCVWIDPASITIKLTVKNQTVFEFDNSKKQVYNFFDRSHIHSNSENIYYSSTNTQNRPVIIQFGVNSHVNNSITSALSLNCSSDSRLFNAQDGDAQLTVTANFGGFVSQCNMVVITSFYAETTFNTDGTVSVNNHQNNWVGEHPQENDEPDSHSFDNTNINDVVDAVKEVATVDAPVSDPKKPGVIESVSVKSKSSNGEKVPRFVKDEKTPDDDVKSKSINQDPYTAVNMTG